METSPKSRGARDEIEPQSGEFEYIVGRQGRQGVVTANRRGHPSQEFLGRHGNDHDVVGAGIERRDDSLRDRLGVDDEQRNPEPRTKAAAQLQDFGRHRSDDDDQIGAMPVDSLDHVGEELDEQDCMTSIPEIPREIDSLRETPALRPERTSCRRVTAGRANELPPGRSTSAGPTC